MISIIICSINPLLLEKVKANISKTVGTAHEFLIHDNRDANLGICQAYNKCASQAKYKYLCFVHEDVIFDTINWGKKVINFIENGKDVGVIGVAGGKYVPKNFISWGDNPGYDRWNFWSYSKEKKDYEYQGYNPEKEEFSEILTLDGVLLFSTKSVWQAAKFDDKLFTGFHLYDADFTMQAAQSHSNYVCQSIKLRHMSSGDGKSKNYYDNLQLFHKKWKKRLPYSVKGITFNKNYEINKELDNVVYLAKMFRAHYGIIFTILYFIKLNRFAICLNMVRIAAERLILKCLKKMFRY